MFISWLILSLIFKTVLSVSLGKQYYDLTTTKYVQKTNTNNPQISQNNEFKPSHHDYESRIQEHDFQDIGDVITFTNDLGHIGIQLPLVPSRKTRRRKRNQVTGAIGLGTVQDVYALSPSLSYPSSPKENRTYNVLVNVGNTSTPLVLGPSLFVFHPFHSYIIHLPPFRHRLIGPMAPLNLLHELSSRLHNFVRSSPSALPCQ